MRLRRAQEIAEDGKVGGGAFAFVAASLIHGFGAFESLHGRFDAGGGFFDFRLLQFAIHAHQPGAHVQQFPPNTLLRQFQAAFRVEGGPVLLAPQQRIL